MQNDKLHKSLALQRQYDYVKIGEILFSTEECTMDLRVASNTITMMRRVLDPKSAVEPFYETKNIKPKFVDTPISAPFLRSSPESCGVSSEDVKNFFKEVAENDELDMHCITLIKDGKVIAEADFGPYDRSVWHISFSQCKSLVGLAIGMLIDEGKICLDDKVVKLLDARTPAVAYLTGAKDLTVRDLLTMSTNIIFNETGAATETDWIRGYFESYMSNEGNRRFNYNSMNTYILSAVVKEVSGQNLSYYLYPRLFKPLNIEKVYWEQCPNGIEKGGWGLYMRQEDMAKIGQLVMQRGNWEGKQLISREWIDEASSLQMVTPRSLGNFNYGYQMWLGRDTNTFLFNGMFGQNLIGWKDAGIIMVLNAGNDDMFQNSPIFDIAHKYFGKTFKIKIDENPEAYEDMQAYLLSLCDRNKELLPLPTYCENIAGKTFYLKSSNAPSVSLQPILMQLLQNNFASGMESIEFSLSDDKFYMTLHEVAEDYKLAIGFSQPEYNDILMGVENHRVATNARFSYDEDGILVLIIRVSFIESACTRTFKFFFDETFEKMQAKSVETPGTGFMMGAIKAQLQGTQDMLANKFGKGDSDYFEFMLKNMVNKRFRADTTFEEVLNEEKD